jgi:hypothetical protein
MKAIHGVSLFLLTSMGVFIGLWAVRYGSRAEVHVEPIHADTPAPAPVLEVAPPPAPKCTHETCLERPKYMGCLEGGNWCSRWEIYYEHHCDCDRWAP